MYVCLTYFGLLDLMNIDKNMNVILDPIQFFCNLSRGLFGSRKYLRSIFEINLWKIKKKSTQSYIWADLRLIFDNH